jgi:hypothetical protein
VWYILQYFFGESMFEMNRSRIDYFLIWGHGIHLLSDIQAILEKQKDMKILKIIKHTPVSVRKLIKEVYSYDYAPVQHLKSKTRYLLKTPATVFFLFIENCHPDEDWFGTGAFRHIECKKIKSLKSLIRDKYNIRKDIREKENHVVHASDNELQTHFILKYLKYEDGVNTFKNDGYYIKWPHHLKKRKEFCLEEISIDQLYANVFVGKGKKECRLLADTVHFKSLSDGSDLYAEYLRNFLGKKMKDHYSINKFSTLAKDLEYLGEGHELEYIIAKKKDERYIILDGLHRACILKKRNVGKLIIAKVAE